jgi:propionate CoA-transferase
MEGGRITERASEPLIRKITIDGEQYLFYPTFPVDVALICATSADDDGNLSWEDEPLTSANVALALAAKACGGKVIAQVRKRVGKQQRPATAVGLPGVFVDHVVLVEDMLMTSGTAYDPAYTGRRARSLSTLPAMPFTPARIVAHRAAREVRKRELSIFGFGAAADIPRAMVEQKLINPEAILDGLPDDATPPLGEALSVAIVATRADLRTARDWIPRRIRPFDSCRVSHRMPIPSVMPLDRSNRDRPAASKQCGCVLA